MAVEVRRVGQAVILKLEGRLALGTAVDQFRASWSDAINQGANLVLIDLSNVTYLDSTGIGTIIRCHSAVKAADGRLRIFGAHGAVRQAFKVTRLDKIFEFHEDEKSALASA